MAFTVTKPFALLCEGDADRAFFVRLLDQRKITDVDVPPYKLGGGVDKLGEMLRALAGDPVGYRKLKGVLVVADAADDVGVTFRKICKKLDRDGPFVAPAKFKRPLGAYQTTVQPPGHPCVTILLLPLGFPGALETVCAEVIKQSRPWLAQCVDAYLSCGEIEALTWPAEKRDKARVQCMIAALYKKDPNKGLHYLLKEQPPMIHFKSTVLTPIVREIRRFRREVNAM